SIVFSILFIVNIILAGIIIFFERQNVSTTWSWLMVLVLIPLLGFILYLIFNKNFSRKHMFYWADKDKVGIKTQVSEQINSIKNGTYNFYNSISKLYKDHIFMHLEKNGAILTENNHVDIYTDGREKFDALLKDIQQAEDHIHIQYYIIHDDGLGTELEIGRAHV